MIGGNVEAKLQIRSVGEKNAIGQRATLWMDVAILSGWLDLSTGDSKHTSYNAKVQESTHIFIMDYQPFEKRIRAENARLIISDTVYDVMLIDDPMQMHRQLEIYLKYTGGQ